MNKGQEKKNARKKAVKIKVFKRREAIRSERKKDELQKMKEIAMNELMNGKPKPFVKNRPKPIVFDQKAVNEKLENNYKILEALEQEYDQEQALRVQMNQKLESEGFNTMKEKMDALHEKALHLTGKADLLEEEARNQAEEIQDVEII